MKQYSFLNESIGRELVGASRFTSRKKVAEQILSLYPQPDMLAEKLQSMAEETFGKEKQQLLDLSLKCRGCTSETYPKFVNSITGFSALWKYLGIGVGSIAAATAANYALNKYNEDPAPDLKGAIKRIPGAQAVYNKLNNLYVNHYNK